jgi:hypothetical protein
MRYSFPYGRIEANVRLIMMPRISFVFIVAIGLLGCQDYGGSSANVRLPSYISFNYTAYDTLGVVTEKGTLHLSTDNSHVTGYWTFDDGSTGNLAGSIDNDMIQIDLYPGYADHNLILTGRYSGSAFSGEWILYGWSLLGRGSFIATVQSGWLRG